MARVQVGSACAGCGCGVGALGWVGERVLAMLTVFVVLPASLHLSSEHIQVVHKGITKSSSIATLSTAWSCKRLKSRELQGHCQLDSPAPPRLPERRGSSCYLFV